MFCYSKKRVEREKLVEEEELEKKKIRGGRVEGILIVLLSLSLSPSPRKEKRKTVLVVTGPKVMINKKKQTPERKKTKNNASVFAKKKNKKLRRLKTPKC